MGTVTSPLHGGQYVYIQGPLNKFYQVMNPEPFNYRTGDSTTAEFSTVPSGSSSGFKNIVVMEPDNNPPRLFWQVWGVEDTEVQYKIAIPTGFARLGTDVDKQVGFIDAFRSSFTDPHPGYAFWTISNFFPAVNAINNSNLTRTPRVWFEGYKYDIHEIKDSPILDGLRNGRIPFTRIALGGVQAQSVQSQRLTA